MLYHAEGSLCFPPGQAFKTDVDGLLYASLSNHIICFSPLKQEPRYSTVMTIFCDVNTNGGYYIPPEYEHSKDDNDAAQSSSNTPMEEYNHDGIQNSMLKEWPKKLLS